ncbi:MAG: ABC transporter ATP-binding protein [Anaerolineae bacterium]|nr:ABC transporter ATP-binding protein [Anaerolineae bacterium]GIK83340.1 MAG: ABC transporter ATP-binding protein [Alphaproteobacteria bacterium]
MSDILLRLDQLHAGYGQVPVLHGVSITIPRGAVTTLIGRNGMGKTTTVKAITGQLPARHGSLRFGDRDITGLPDWRVARAGIGLVPEGRAIFPNLSVRENLICGAANRHRAPKPWTLERVFAAFPRLEERQANLGANLSGGEQQMLAIGRALMTNPLLLILDEATEGLAPLIRREIWNCLDNLKQTGLSMLVIDKNIRALCQIADHHHVLEKGRIVWEGSTSALMADWATVRSHVSI